jgi:LmbE family N-acetylglucosaminyl deacetylase
MIQLNADFARSRTPGILLIGAHADDIEIGCGGTVQWLLQRYPRARLTWVVLSGSAARVSEARRGARRLLARATRAEIIIGDFRDAYFPAQFGPVKEFFDQLKKRMQPHLIFTHQRDDLHQDHRVVSELTWNSFRDHLILEYEIPKFDGGLGSPSVFVPLTRAQVTRKVRLLMSVYGSQRSKRWFTEETFTGLMRLRGIECNAPEGYAEAFYGRKLLLG